MADPYTIRIYVADGDPEGLRLIDQINWTGRGAVFPRLRWPNIRKREEFAGPGVYLLWGFIKDDGLPTLYVGQGDCVADRIENHFKNKEFWQYGIAFTSTSPHFNSAHARWLEFALVRDANLAKESHLDNGTQPQEPALAEGDKQEACKFLREVRCILPLVGLRALEKTKHIEPKAATRADRDTIVVPANPDGFEETFLGEDCWHEIRVAGGMLDKIKWIAAYVTLPVSAITHVAQVKHLEPYGNEGKYRVVFSAPAKELPKPIPFGDAPKGSMQGPRYTTIKKLTAAKKLTEVF